MNRSLRKYVYAISAIMIIILLSLTYVQFVKENSLVLNKANRRILYSEYSRRRGQITANGEVLANSEPTTDYIQQQRHYLTTYSIPFAPITGYYSLWYGKTGLEYSENNILSGSDPRLAGSRFIDEIAGHDPKGGNVDITVIPLLQLVAYHELNSACDNGNDSNDRTHPCKGAAVAIDPDTGRILALTSTPSFDPNLLVDKSYQVENTSYRSYQSNPAKPMLDRALQSAYSSPATMKILSTAAALEAGIHPEAPLATQATPPLPTHPSTRCANLTAKNPKGTMSLRKAFIDSCEAPFVNLVTNKLAHPRSSIAAIAEKLGVDNPTLFSLPLTTTASTLGEQPDNPPNIAELALGKGDTRFTPLTNALMLSAIANNGILMRPYLVNRIVRSDLTLLQATTPQQLSQPFSEKTAKELRKLMTVSEEHTFGYHKHSYVISSATSSGSNYQKSTENRGNGTDNTNKTRQGWYIAFAEKGHTKIAIAVVVENDGNLGSKGTGTAVAAPIGRKMIEAVLGGE